MILCKYIDFWRVTPGCAARSSSGDTSSRRLSWMPAGWLGDPPRVPLIILEHSGPQLFHSMSLSYWPMSFLGVETIACAFSYIKHIAHFLAHKEQHLVNIGWMDGWMEGNCLSWRSGPPQLTIFPRMERFLYHSYKILIHSTFVPKTWNNLSGDAYFSDLCVSPSQDKYGLPRVPWLYSAPHFPEPREVCCLLASV